MKLRTERDALLEAITSAGRAATPRGAGGFSSPSLKLSLRGNQLEVTGSDPDLVITTRADVVGEVDGDSLVPARLVQDIVRSFDPGVVAIMTTEDEIRISSGRAEFNVREPVGAELSLLGRAEGEGISLPADVLADGLRQVGCAALTDDSRAPQLTGILLTATKDGLRLVATDSYRLAFRDLPDVNALDPGAEVLVPARALGELQRLIASSSTKVASLTFRHSDLDAVFDFDTVRLTTRLLRGPFPEYERLLPDHYDKSIVLERESLIVALKRVRLLLRDTKDTAAPVRLMLTQSGMELSVVTTESGNASERVDGDYTGDDIVVAFNPTYLLDGIEAIHTEQITLEVIDSSKPATVKGVGDDHYSYLLMPVRVS